VQSRMRSVRRSSPNPPPIQLFDPSTLQRSARLDPLTVNGHAAIMETIFPFDFVFAQVTLSHSFC